MKKIEKIQYKICVLIFILITFNTYANAKMNYSVGVKYGIIEILDNVYGNSLGYSFNILTSSIFDFETELMYSKGKEIKIARYVSFGPYMRKRPYGEFIEYDIIHLPLLLKYKFKCDSSPFISFNIGLDFIYITQTLVIPEFGIWNGPYWGKSTTIETVPVIGFEMNYKIKENLSIPVEIRLTRITSFTNDKSGKIQVFAGIDYRFNK